MKELKKYKHFHVLLLLLHQHLSESAIDRCFTKKLFRELLLQSLGNSSLQIPLINFWPIFPFHTRWKHEKTFGFLVFSEGIKWAHRPEMFHKVTGLHATAADVSTESDVTHVKNYSTNVWKLPGFSKNFDNLWKNTWRLNSFLS